MSLPFCHPTRLPYLARNAIRLLRNFATQSLRTGDTFTRASGHLWLDSDNNLRTAGLNEEVYEGKRYLSPGVYSSYDLAGNLISDLKGITTGPAVTNKCQTFGFVPDDEPISVWDDDFTTDSTGSYSLSETTLSHDPSGFMRATYTSTNNNKGFYRGGGVVTAGKIFRVRFKAKGTRATPFGSVGNNDDLGSQTVTSNPAITSEYQNYDFAFLSTGNLCRFYQNGGDIGDVLDMDDLLIEEIKYAVGTKSFHDGFGFIQNIDGLPLSGDIACVLSIVDDTAQLDTNGYGGVEQNGKCYHLDNSLASSVGFCVPSGAAGNLNNHSTQVVAKVIIGSGGIYLSGDEGSKLDFSNSFYSIADNENKVPLSTTAKVILYIPPGAKYNFLLPGLYEQSYAPRQPVPASSLVASTTRSVNLTTLPVIMPQSFEVTIEVTPDADGSSISPTWTARIFGTNDSRNYLNECYCTVTGSYGVTRRAEGGCIFNIHRDDLVKNVPAVYKFSIKLDGLNTIGSVVKDGVIKHSSSAAGVLDHSNLDKLEVGGWSNYCFAGQVKLIEVKAI